MAERASERAAIARRGKRLEYFTIAWNGTEGLIAVVAGVLSGSVALIGFGVDSFIEVISGSALLWRMSAEAGENKDRIERAALRIVGACFLALAAYLLYDGGDHLWNHKPPEHNLPGIIVAIISLIVMPLLSRAKRRVGEELGSAAMKADAKQTLFCVYLSGLLLAGLMLNAFFGLWWADACAGFVMVPLIAQEGIESLRNKT